MSDASSERIADFHQDLLGLAAAGIAVDLGFSNSATIEQSLDQSLRVIKSAAYEQGIPIKEAIAAMPDLPVRYRTAALTWLECDDPAIALDFVTTPGVAQQNLSRSLGQSLLYPMIVLALTYVAFLFLCNVTSPQMDAIYEQLGKAPSDSLSFLATCRESMPIWGIAIPLLAILSVIWWKKRGANRQWSWLPGSRRYFDANRNAGVARQMARMIDGGMSLENAVALSLPTIGVGSSSVGSNSVDSGGASSSGAHLGGASLSGVEGRRSSEALSPLLDWAIHSDIETQPRSRVLSMVADTYSRTARRRASILRVAIPAVLGVLIGGVLVFGYGLSFFMPMIELLKEISAPEGAY